MKTFFTSESVTEGHPDKVCDIISDSVLDYILKKDKNARVACECCATTDFLLIMGEITSTVTAPFKRIARKEIKNIGYTDGNIGFSYKTCKINVKLEKQSPDIALGVDRDGAGDQGIVYGYACDETEELMPMPISLSHKLAKRLAEARKSGEISWLRPDGKTQVTVEYENDKPVRVDTVIVSAQHNEDVDYKTICKEIKEKVIKAVIDKSLLDENTKYYINPTGKFATGGPHGDSGLTGRKIIVDTYGGYCGHGGGAFSGKDPTKVDRSASYMARYVCKNLVAAKLCKRCELQIAYAIGVAEPVSVQLNTFGTGVLDDEALTEIIKKVFDFKPKAIIEFLNLRNISYKKTASYGHFGNKEYNWEKLGSVKALKSQITNYKLQITNAEF